MEQNTWDIGAFYTKAWQIIKKHKMLWIFGIAASAGASSSFRGSQNFDPEAFQGIGKLFSNPETQTSVLGAEAVAAESSFLSVFSDIPYYIYGILGVEVLFLVLLSVVIGLIYKAWATLSLLHAAENGIQDQQISLAETSTKAFAQLRPMLWLLIVPPLILVLDSIAVITLVLSPLFIGLELAWLTAIGTVIAIPILTVIVLRYTLSNIWAPRNILYQNLSGKKALVTGYHQTKGRFWQMILLGVVNMIAGGIVMFIPVALIVGVVVAVGLTLVRSNPNSLIILLPLGLIVGVAVFVGISLLSGIITSFKAIVWSLAYKTITK